MQSFLRSICSRAQPAFLPLSLAFPNQSGMVARIFSLIKPSTLTSQMRTYKMKTNSSYKLRFRRSKSSKSDHIKRGYTMHGHRRTGESHAVHLRRAGDAPVAKSYANLIKQKLPRR